ncbi:hypothetical protein [Nocardiopsis sp. LOL_012]|uniref:hypothetical protein n=1 Tax=Nocardiopsis sp. LOL_012 TaxID=3345409 RepID=UPI003A8434A9
MFKTARTSARALLMAAGTAGFVALGSGVAGADVLGAADTLPVGEVTAPVAGALAQGVPAPVDGLGDLARVQPGQNSVDPRIQHHSAPAGDIVDSVTDGTGLPLDAVGDAVDTVGGATGAVEGATGTVPLAHPAGDPVSDLLGGGLPDVGGVLPAADMPVDLDTGGTLPLAAPADGPLALDRENFDATGGLGTLLGVAETLPMAAPESLTGGLPVDEIGSLGGDVASVQGLPEVGRPEVDPRQVTGLLPGALV